MLSFGQEAPTQPTTPCIGHDKDVLSNYSFLLSFFTLLFYQKFLEISNERRWGRKGEEGELDK